MVTTTATTSAGDREAGPRSGYPLPSEADRSPARWRPLLHAALMALPFVLGVLVPVLLLALLYWLS